MKDLSGVDAEFFGVGLEVQADALGVAGPSPASLESRKGGLIDVDVRRDSDLFDPGRFAGLATLLANRNDERVGWLLLRHRRHRKG